MPLFGDEDMNKLRGAPISRQEAEDAYRKIRAYMLFSAVWFFAIAAVIAVLGFDGWQLYLGAVLVVEGIGIPGFLYIYRRELEERVRSGEESAGKVSFARQELSE